MLAINTAIDVKATHMVRCPECRGRICDLVVSDQSVCRHKYKVVYDKNSKSHITIKCGKCGLLVGISFMHK